LVALKSADGDILNILLAGDDLLIDLETANYDAATFYLLCYYYVFGEAYPPKWSEFLTFLQVHCLKDTGSVKKGFLFANLRKN
jgi:hypothetical protein